MRAIATLKTFREVKIDHESIEHITGKIYRGRQSPLRFALYFSTKLAWQELTLRRSCSRPTVFDIERATQFLFQDHEVVVQIYPRPIEQHSNEVTLWCPSFPGLLHLPKGAS